MKMTGTNYKYEVEANTPKGWKPLGMRRTLAKAMALAKGKECRIKRITTDYFLP